MSQKVIIIGAGIGGIATANLLAKAGYDVAIYEKNSQPGGRAGKMIVDGFTFDTGPSWYLMPEVFAHYFSLFEKSIEEELDLVRLSPAYKVFFENNTPITITGDSKTDTETFETIEAGAGAKLSTYIDKSNDIYQLSLKHFLYTNFSSYRDFMKPDILQKSHVMAGLAITPIDKYVSRFVSDQRLRQILEYPMVFLGSSPFSAPAIYSLMSALDFREGVFYPRGGLYTIIEHLVSIGKKLDVTYHYDSPVKQIKVSHQAAAGVILSDGTHVDADIVISNADLHFTETQLLQPKYQSYPARYWNKKESAPSALLMYLGLKGELSELEHHNLFFVDDWKQNFEDIFGNKKLPYPASLYICKPSATDTSVAPKGYENVFVLVPLPSGVSVAKKDMDGLADKYLSLIEKITGVSDLRSRIVVKKLFGPNDFVNKFNAWQGTALGPSHILRQSAMFRTPNKSRKLKNLYYVGGSTAPGIGLPMCLIGAELIYKRLAGDKIGGPIKSVINFVGKVK
ncbi:MAG: phytoene desaturase family protein [Candidatus Saccharimonadales bacterium]